MIGKAFSRVKINGNRTTEFEIMRGVRQGCSLSPFLLVLATRPLLKELDKLRSGQGDRGIIVQGHTFSYDFFVDDGGFYITEDEDDYNKVKKVLNAFSIASGI